MSDQSPRAALLLVKLRALAIDHGADPAGVVPGDFGLGAALTAGDEAWVLLDRDARLGLGPALIWALRRDAVRLHLLADTATGLLARRAAAFRLPISVWLVDGRALIEALPDELPAPAELPAAHRQFEALIREAGAVPVIEHGVLTGEVAGLEVCRVVTDPDSGEVRLDVGVGAHDRETFQLLHGDRPKIEALAGVVAAVSPHRLPSAAIHPLNRLAASRGLRAALIARPRLIGASHVAPIDPPFARPNVKDAVPCVALATIAGEPTLVVCSAGVDLDVVPFATDARLASGVQPCLLVVAPRDLLAAQQLLAEYVIDPLRFVAVDIEAASDSPTSP
jgi:hypothetical protein